MKKPIITIILMFLIAISNTTPIFHLDTVQAATEPLPTQNFGVDTDLSDTSTSELFHEECKGTLYPNYLYGKAKSITAYLSYSQPDQATLGINSPGGIVEEISTIDTIRGEKITTPYSPILVQSISAYIQYSELSQYSMKAAIYDMDGHLVDQTVEITPPIGVNTLQFPVTFSFNTPVRLEASTDYIIAVWSTTATGNKALISYQEGGDNGYYTQQSYGEWPQTANLTPHTGMNYRIYCTYQIIEPARAQAAIFFPGYTDYTSPSLSLPPWLVKTEEVTLSPSEGGWITFNLDPSTAPTLSTLYMKNNYALLVWTNDPDNVRFYYDHDKPYSQYDTGDGTYLEGIGTYPTWPEGFSFTSLNVLTGTGGRWYYAYCTVESGQILTELTVNCNPQVIDPLGDTQVTISGRLTEQTTGIGISGAVIRLSTSDGLGDISIGLPYTDSEGYYTYTLNWNMLAANTYPIKAYYDGNWNPYGNQQAETQLTVTGVPVLDVTPPTITVHDIEIEAIDQYGAYVSLNDLMATVTDDMDPDPALDSNFIQGFYSIGYTGTITWTAKDHSGNKATATQTFTIVEKTPPTITINGVSDLGLYAKGSACFTYSAIDDLEGDIPCSGSLNGVKIDTLPYYPDVGVHTLTVSATDISGNTATKIITFIVYDATGGFVTGGGWIDSPPGAYSADISLTGEAAFGFVSKYQKGASLPMGSTWFQFQIAGMNFKSTSYDWLVVSSSLSQYKGSGSINDQGVYKFQLWAGDGAKTGVDTFRIKIWNQFTDEVIYDNGMNQVICGGSIIIHK